jgi:hypothetical protein
MGNVLRQRLPLVLMVATCVAAVAAAVSGAASPTTGLQFTQAGHWVANSELGMVFHINGAARTVDARAEVPGMEPGSRVVQGETSGYVVGNSRIIEFGKSDLSVEHSTNTPSGEQPVAVETPGGPYVVYRQAGTVVRLGDPPARIQTGGAVGDPVATPDGTLWLHRVGTGVLCQLPKGSESVTCPTAVPTGHTGALTTVGDRAVFVDTSADVLRTVSPGGLGEPVAIGTDVQANARVAPADASGRIAILDPDSRRLVLAAPGDLNNGKAAASPEIVPLPNGDYAGPAAAGSSVVLLDRTRNTVLTYDNKGKQQRTTPIPKENGEPRLSRGEDKRVYVEGAEGKHVLVVNHDGEVGHVPVVGEKRPEERAPQPPPPPVVPPTQSANAPDVRAGGQPQRQEPRRQEPRRQQPAPPRPVPASPPGVSPGFTATVQGGNLRLAWGAAAANGAPVTAYHVSWSPATASGAGSTQGGGVRSMVMTGLQQGVVYTISVVAQNSAGRGAPATTQATVPVAQTRSITVSRGTTERYNETCEVPACGKMRVVMRGFEPRKSYKIQPFSNANYSNGGVTWTTDRNGNLTFERFHFGQVGATVWVMVDGKYKSNELKWVSG